MRLLLRRWVWSSCMTRLNQTSREKNGNIRRCLNPSRSLSTSATDEFIFKSPRPAEDLGPGESLTDYMFSRFDMYGNKEALVDDATGKTYIFSELQELTRKIGSFLIKQGFQRGDIICYYGTNNPEFTLLLLGCASIGVVITTANPAYTAGELTKQMQHAGAKHVVSVPVLAPKLDQTDIPKENQWMIGEAPGYRTVQEMMLDDGKAFPEKVEINPIEDVLILPYSSGTTGMPKGVMLTHHNVVANLKQFKNAIITTEADTNFGVLPFFHIYGLAPVMLGTLQDGGTLLTTPGFDPQAFLTAIQKRKVTQLHLVPPIILFMARHPVVDKFDLSSVRDVVCAAAPLGEGLTNEFVERFKVNIKQGYGLSETSPVVSIDESPVTVGSVGPLIANTELKVVDPDTGSSLDRNQTGEICVRGPQNMKGYLNNERATQEMITADGWLHTGDIGYIRDNDCIVITDRLKELIKYKGMQVAPAELEDLIHQHPAIQDVAVIGVPDDRAGEVPKAFVVKSANKDVSEEDIKNYVEQNTSEHKHLRGGVEFLDEIPKSPSGKILRRLLK